MRARERRAVVRQRVLALNAEAAPAALRSVPVRELGKVGSAPSGAAQRWWSGARSAPHRWVAKAAALYRRTAGRLAAPEQPAGTRGVA